MMRPQQIGSGVDHELLVGLLGAKVVLDDVRGLIAWLAEAYRPDDPPAVTPELVDVLVGLASLVTVIDRQLASAASAGGPERPEPDDGDPERGAPLTLEDLLR